LGKFPSVKDERSVTRGEVLALRLAKLAGIDTAHARIVMAQGAPMRGWMRLMRCWHSQSPGVHPQCPTWPGALNEQDVTFAHLITSGANHITQKLALNVEGSK